MTMAVTAAAAAPARADVQEHEMLLVHRILRRELRLAPGLVRGVRPGDTERTGAVVEHLSDLLTALHRHQREEEAQLWPRPVGQADRVYLDPGLVRRVQARQDRTAALVEQLALRLPRWRDTAGAAERDAVADTLDLLVLDLAQRSAERPECEREQQWERASWRLLDARRYRQAVRRIRQSLSRP